MSVRLEATRIPHLRAFVRPFEVSRAEIRFYGIWMASPNNGFAYPVFHTKLFRLRDDAFGWDLHFESVWNVALDDSNEEEDPQNEQPRKTGQFRAGEGQLLSWVNSSTGVRAKLEFAGSSFQARDSTPWVDAVCVSGEKSLWGTTWVTLDRLSKVQLWDERLNSVAVLPPPSLAPETERTRLFCNPTCAGLQFFIADGDLAVTRLWGGLLERETLNFAGWLQNLSHLQYVRFPTSSRMEYVQGPSRQFLKWIGGHHWEQCSPQFYANSSLWNRFAYDSKFDGNEWIYSVTLPFDGVGYPLETPLDVDVLPFPDDSDPDIFWISDSKSVLRLRALREIPSLVELSARAHARLILNSLPDSRCSKFVRLHMNELDSRTTKTSNTILAYTN